MSNQESNLPMLNQIKKGTFISDKEIATGAWVSTINKDGKFLNDGYIMTCEAYDESNSITVNCMGTKTNAVSAEYNGRVARFRFESGKGEKENFSEKYGVLHFDGKPVPTGIKRIKIAEVISDTGMRFPMFRFFRNEKLDWPCFVEENKGVKVRLPDGRITFAEEILKPNVKNIGDVPVFYSDGAKVSKDTAEYFEIGFKPAEIIDGGIQCGSGVATQLGPQWKFLQENYKNGDKINLTKLGFSRVQSLINDADKLNAEIMAEIGSEIYIQNKKKKLEQDFTRLLESVLQENVKS